MGSFTIGQDARIYYYPEPDALSALREFDFDGIPGVCDPQPFHNAYSGMDLGGGVKTQMLGGHWRVRVTLERFFDTDGARVRRLRALLSHLRRGHAIAMTMDHARTWGSDVPIAPTAGDTNMATSGNLYTAYSSGSLGPGDHVIVQSPNPYFYHEQLALSSVTGATLNHVGSPMLFDHISDTLVRWEGFWPHLKLDPAQRNAPLLVDERRRVWTLDMTLVSQTADEHADLGQG